MSYVVGPLDDSIYEMVRRKEPTNASSISAPVLLKLRVKAAAPPHTAAPVGAADGECQGSPFVPSAAEVVPRSDVAPDVIQDVVQQVCRYTQSTCCFWDRHPFSTRPVGLITHLDCHGMTQWGHFCSPECAIAFSRREPYQLSERWKMQENMQYVYGRQIHASPDWQLLTAYGGHLTIEQFRRLSTVLETEVVLNHFPVHQRSSYGSVVPRVEPTNMAYIPMTESQVRQTKSADMRLKRSKPLPGSSGSGLWGAMNIRGGADTVP